MCHCPSSLIPRLFCFLTFFSSFRDLFSYCYGKCWKACFFEFWKVFYLLFIMTICQTFLHTYNFKFNICYSSIFLFLHRLDVSVVFILRQYFLNSYITQIILKIFYHLKIFSYLLWQTKSILSDFFFTIYVYFFSLKMSGKTRTRFTIYYLSLILS